VTTIAGLSPTMCAVLQAVAEGRGVLDMFTARRCSYIGQQDVTRTVKALVRRQLITRGERGGRLVYWQLTDAGRALLNRLDGAR
jgi:DNA-binding MarR family transcriptional regulator